MNEVYLKETTVFYDKAYKKLGFEAQRRFPNEELCRFMGRNFFHIQLEERKKIKILETGCGSGANLWMLAKEGFDTYGIDLSKEAIDLSKKMLSQYNTRTTLEVQNMEDLNFPNNFFDAVIDVFSSYCLTKNQGKEYLKSVQKVLKPGGRFFSYFPAKSSDSFQYPGNSRFIDQDTLESMTREDSPFTGQMYPFRFLHPREYQNALLDLEFKVPYLEEVGRTYGNMKEYFGFIVIEGIKKK